MKILVLNYEYPPIGGGGGAVCKSLAHALAKRGHHLRVQTSWIKGLESFTETTYAEDTEQQISKQSMPPGQSRPGHSRPGHLEVFRSFSFRRKADTCTVWEMLLFLICNFFPTLKHILTWKPDLIHVHFAVPTGALAWLTGLLTRTPYILTIHLGDVPGALPDQTDHLFRFLKPLTIPIWKRARRIVAVSEFVKRLGNEAYGLPIQTIFNGIAPPRPSEKEPSPNRFTFISVGRLNEQKNLGFMLELLADLPQRDWRYQIVGDGPMHAIWKDKAKDLEIENNVIFRGWLSKEEVFEHIQESHLLLMPSHAEGLPMVGIQALFLGCPILGSKIEGLQDLVQDGDQGWLIPLDQRDMWRERLNLILKKPEQLHRMRELAKKHAESFHIDYIAEEYDLLFQSVVSES